MQFARENLQKHSVQRYSAESIDIAGTTYHGSLAVTPDEILIDWRCSSTDSLDEVLMTRLTEGDPEVIVIATGEAVSFPSAPIMHAAMRQGIGVEVMNDGAAIRTFNVLLSESRRAVLAVIRP